MPEHLQLGQARTNAGDSASRPVVSARCQHSDHRHRHRNRPGWGCASCQHLCGQLRPISLLYQVRVRLDTAALFHDGGVHGDGLVGGQLAIMLPIEDHDEVIQPPYVLHQVLLSAPPSSTGSLAHTGLPLCPPSPRQWSRRSRRGPGPQQGYAQAEATACALPCPAACATIQARGVRSHERPQRLARTTRL